MCGCWFYLSGGRQLAIDMVVVGMIEKQIISVGCLVRCWVSGAICVLFLFLAWCAATVVVVAGGLGVLCENCIVDASNFFHLYFLFSVLVLCALFMVFLLLKGARWMPWQSKPMKDV